MLSSWVGKVSIAVTGVLLVLGTAGCAVTPVQLLHALSTETPAAAASPAASSTGATTPQASTSPKKANQPAVVLPVGLRALGLEGGVVTSNDGTTLSLKLGKATEVLQVALSTIIAIPGKAGATVSDIHSGDRVVADVPGSDANAPAALVLDFPAGYTKDNTVIGAIQANAKGTLTVRVRGGGTRQITTNASTFVVNLSQNQPATGTLAEVKRGSAVLVVGQGTNDAFTAQVIIVLDRNAVTRTLKKSAPTPTPAATPTP